jgi:tRNA (adenine57-N1/adenine58-N1)-methyltransferase
MPKKTSPLQSNWFAERQSLTRAGDLVLLLTADLKRYVIKLTPGRDMHTHQGVFPHDDLIGQPYGGAVVSRLGAQALLLEPSLTDLIKHLKRGTQIIYPKDAAYLVHKLNLRAGSTVVEAGTGSGGLTTALAWAVAPTGRVFTYETREHNYQLARNNLDRVALLPYVEMHLRDIEDGFLQQDADALMLDVREPWRYLAQARTALRTGGFFASLTPTVNQVIELLAGLEANGFADIGVEEVLVRRYKPVPERLRPEDEMVAHTGYLVSARLIDASLDPKQWLSKERRRYQARVEAQARIAEAEAAREAERQAGGRKYPKLPLPG